ncbi:metallophosphoesterase 1-like [Diadema antillarum]|uniref:metallophosphoesterase 1-like n=1 Tax=Diadema antillarum TaxID=105358 RepID=UPI003A866315
MAIYTNIRALFSFLAYFGLVVIVCEYLVYYFVMFKCVWPNVSVTNDHRHIGQIGESEWFFSENSDSHPQSYGEDNSVEKDAQTRSSDSLRTFFIADTHLLGSRLGHWFDKLRREWQMERAFQAALTLLAPEAVFVLGDLTDEGKWASDEEFRDTAKHFWKMFRHPANVNFKVVVGNHDIGFHHLSIKNKLDRFLDAFSCKGVELVTLKNISFVLVNSMAFHGDNCEMCLGAKKDLRRVSERLNCSRNRRARTGSKTVITQDKKCKVHKPLPPSAPILLQHFPLYRRSDEMCSGVDGTPLDEKFVPHGERREVISREATKILLSWIRPRLVLSGHTHHGCYVVHQNSTPEISVPSFSWRNRRNPSITLATITPRSISINKCFLPEESLIVNLYILSGVAMAVFLLRAWIRLLFKGRARREHRKDL